MISTAALREIHQLHRQADEILSKPEVTRSDVKKADLLISNIATIRLTGLSSDEMRQQLGKAIGREIGAPEVTFDDRPAEVRAHEKIFRRYISGRLYSGQEVNEELRSAGFEIESAEKRATSFLAGQQTLAFTDGPTGGFLVPIAFAKVVAEARAAIDPFFDENVVTLIQENNFTLPQLQIPGWDVSSISASKVAENTQHDPDLIPGITQKLLSRWTYRATFAGSLEFDEESKAFGSAENALARAIGIAFGRGVGVDLATGNGTTAPQGLVTGAADSGVTQTTAGALSYDDFVNLFFSVNQAYRSQPKSAFVMSDAIYKLAVGAKDTTNRPLFPIVNGVLRILDRPAYMAPSLPSTAGGAGVWFGDLSHMYVHASTLRIQRPSQVPGLCENGMVAWCGLQLVDAAIVDPSDGALPPVVSMKLHV